MNFNIFRKFFFILCLIFVTAFDCFAAELQVKFQDWSVFKTNRGDQEICYMASLPIKTGGDPIERGEPYFVVTNILNDADEISVATGFIYDERKDVELSFGSKKFYLFPYLNLAWANDKNDDIDIIKSMQKKDEMFVNAISKNGRHVSDKYSLIGFLPAYYKMKEICHGYQRHFVKYPVKKRKESK